MANEKIETPTPTIPSATVDGKSVPEFNALFRPAATLVSRENGVHELTRAYFQDGKFSVAFGTNRLGGLDCTGVRYITGRGVVVEFTKGFRVFVPEASCQITWRT